MVVMLYSRFAHACERCLQPYLAGVCAGVAWVTGSREGSLLPVQPITLRPNRSEIALPLPSSYRNARDRLSCPPRCETMRRTPACVRFFSP